MAAQLCGEPGDCHCPRPGKGGRTPPWVLGVWNLSLKPPPSLFWLVISSALSLCIKVTRSSAEPATGGWSCNLHRQLLVLSAYCLVSQIEDLSDSDPRKKMTTRLCSCHSTQGSRQVLGPSSGQQCPPHGALQNCLPPARGLLSPAILKTVVSVLPGAHVVFLATVLFTASRGAQRTLWGSQRVAEILSSASPALPFQYSQLLDLHSPVRNDRESLFKKKKRQEVQRKVLAWKAPLT